MLAGFRATLGVVTLALAVGAAGSTRAGGNAPASAVAPANGRAIYLEGMRAGGGAVVADRAGGMGASGATAACVNCHRRSGFGGNEGRSYIPPINAASLFERRLPGTGASASGTGRPAYTEQSLARAIRDGVDPTGRRLDYLMPRYRLGDDELRSLVAYLRQLSTQPSPGTSAQAVDFATVVAPDVPRERSRAMVEVLQACVDDHNAGPPPKRGRKLLGPELSLSQQRKWRLHVWELEGAPGTWERQLASHAKRQPVFAMVGGLGGGQWAPVHEFCERDALPCLFPQVEVPVADATAFYPLYLSQSVLLEAAIIGRELTQEGRAARRVVQVLRTGDEGARSGAEALRRNLAERGVQEQELRVDASVPLDAGTLEAAVGADALVLWMRPDDLKRLERLDPVPAQLYLSATLMDSGEAALPAAWKAHALMAYPFELPENRTTRMGTVHTWLQAHGIAPAQERVQADAYVACAALGAGMNEVADHLQRDYLVERLETIMERGTATGLYPRLALGVGQRFASKTGYLVRFEDARSGQLVPVGERIAP